MWLLKANKNSEEVKGSDTAGTCWFCFVLFLFCFLLFFAIECLLVNSFLIPNQRVIPLNGFLLAWGII